MKRQKLSSLEMRIMEVCWTTPEVSIRQIQEAFPESGRPAYATVQTTVYRLEEKGALRRTRRLGNFHMFSAAVSKGDVQRNLVDELLAVFNGDSRPLMAHLIDAGKLDAEDIEFAEQILRSSKREETQ